MVSNNRETTPAFDPTAETGGGLRGRLETAGIVFATLVAVIMIAMYVAVGAVQALFEKDV